MAEDAAEVGRRSVQSAYELTIVSPTFNERANVRALIAKLDAALAGVAWQVIFVDDNSPDGTAEEVKAAARDDSRVHCIRRVGRRGLAGAVLEGALASAAPFVAVIDADLQHDETLLPAMLDMLRADAADMVVASRYLEPEGLATGLSQTRQQGSRLATWMGRQVLRNDVSDPVSGYFMAKRAVWDVTAPKLTTEGFKVLFDILASHPDPIRVAELPYRFRDRLAGESKLDRRIVIEYVSLILNKATNDMIPARAIMFALVGSTGFLVNVAVVLLLDVTHARLPFWGVQLSAALVAMTSNYLINNVITYHDRRRKGLALLSGYIRFCLLCSAGLFVNVAVASFLNDRLHAPLLSGVAGAAFGAVWNYVTTALAVW
ncbi:MAG: dolichol monophosphate mannose synthase [Caulobacteraceae bacterium]|nr:dolichol monophosphate mannose synthase [Caulobacteraceae bacterium]